MTVGSIISMVVVDDHQYVRNSLMMTFDLWDDIQVIGTAGNCTDGILL